MGEERYAALRGRSNTALLAAESRIEIAEVIAPVRKRRGEARVYLRPPQLRDQEEFLQNLDTKLDRNLSRDPMAALIGAAPAGSRARRRRPRPTGG